MDITAVSNAVTFRAGVKFAHFCRQRRILPKCKLLLRKICTYAVKLLEMLKNCHNCNTAYNFQVICKSWLTPHMRMTAQSDLKKTEFFNF